MLETDDLELVELVRDEIPIHNIGVKSVNFCFCMHENIYICMNVREIPLN